ncbi:MAG: hypothetical protein IKV85_03225 [Ruminococcus sp.]|nr:hypothetical protein [Ruminococcus sp.]
MSKKINFLRAGALTMVLALGTTCFMSGTLAKYVTSGEGSDSARVAKFGVTVTANGETFAETYKTDDGAFAETYSVVSAENVVAPGTSGNMTSMTLTGTPEVAVRVNYEIPEGVTMFSGWEVDGAYYCPIVITVGDKDINGLDYSSEAEFQKEVAEAINGYSKDYPAGTDLSTVGTESLAISWEWPFYVSDANDVKDTALGDAAADDNAATINLTVKTTVTQID